MNVLVGGGTGFIGGKLVSALRSAGHKVKVVTRKPKNDNEISWVFVKDSGVPNDTNVIVNFSGRSIGEINPCFAVRSYYDRYKKEVFSSRIDTTKLLVEASKTVPIHTFINASGAGFYAPDLEVDYTESSPYRHYGLISKLVKEWEDAAQMPSRPHVRQVQLRTGVVLAKDSHFIQSLYMTHRIGLGGPMGSGRQWISWIHVDDLIRVIKFLLQPNTNIKNGPINATSPHPVRQVDMSRALSEALNAPHIPFGPITTPEFVFKLLLGRDRATLVLDGQKVFPQKLLELGFVFRYPRLEDALEAIFDRRPKPIVSK